MHDEQEPAPWQPWAKSPEAMAATENVASTDARLIAAAINNLAWAVEHNACEVNRASQDMIAAWHEGLSSVVDGADDIKTAIDGVASVTGG